MTNILCAEGHVVEKDKELCSRCNQPPVQDEDGNPVVEPILPEYKEPVPTPPIETSETELNPSITTDKPIDTNATNEEPKVESTQENINQ